MVKPIYPREAAALLRVHVQTLQRWDREGILVANRTATNRRYYTLEQIEAHMNPPVRVGVPHD